jgi:uncharacterized membrane protein YqjE
MAVVLNGSPARPTTDQSTSQLVQKASEQITRLVRDEIALAKAELTEKGKHASKGAGLFGGGGVLAMYGVGAMLATIIIALDLVLPLWLAALIVTVVLFVAAGILALLGKKQVGQAGSPEPKDAIFASAKADVDEVKHAIRTRSRA